MPVTPDINQSATPTATSHLKKRRLALPLVLGIVASTTMPALAASTSLTAPGNRASLTSSVVRHGLRITLTVAGGPIPLNGLALTTIKLKNISKASIGLINSACTGQFTHTEALNRKGVPYSWPLPVIALPCPAPFPQPLAPGHSVTTTSIVYLQSGRLRATTTITAGSNFSYKNVSGADLNLHLVSGSREHVVLSSRSGGHNGYTASIRPALTGAGKLWYSEVEICRGGTGATEAGLADAWTSTAGATLSSTLLNSSCHHITWDFIAGWLGHRAVIVRLSVSG